MRYMWSRLLLVLLSLESILFVIVYIKGPCGLTALKNLQSTEKILQHQIQQIQAENSKLQEQIDEWSTELFLQEKYAREKLHMKKQNEKIYIRS